MGESVKTNKSSHINDLNLDKRKRWADDDDDDATQTEIGWYYLDDLQLLLRTQSGSAYRSRATREITTYSLPPVTDTTKRQKKKGVLAQ